MFALEKFLTEYVGEYNLHFLNRYFKFIRYCQERELSIVYNEKHHILPVSLFPQYIFDKWNIIVLSAREHFLAHLLLAYAVGGKQWYSVQLMINTNNIYQYRDIKITSRLYEKIRIASGNISRLKVKEYRALETEEQKQTRIRKWKENYNSKSNEEKKKSRELQKISRKINGKKIILPEYTCLRCYNVVKRRNHKCFITKGHLDERYKFIGCCIKCHREFQKLTSFKKHIEKCEVRLKIIKIIKSESYKCRTIIQCSKCRQKFNSISRFNRHTKIDNCLLTAEERKILGNYRRTLANASRSKEDKLKSNKIISDKVKTFQNHLTENEKREISQKLKNSGKAYYNSDRYDPLLKSEQVKNGIKYAKNNRH